MHRVLQIPEVLLNIFGSLVSSGLSTEDCRIISRDLAALARTCRTFKEPALDVLWSELDDPSPILWCLPEVSRQTALGIHVYSFENFTFTRPLQQAEWDILCSHARRVWHIRCFHRDLKFDWDSLRDLTPGANPLFTNLRSLHGIFTEEMIPFLHLPFPSLTQLDIYFNFAILHDVNPPTILQDPLKSLAKTSPKLRKLDVRCSIHGLELSKIISDGICGWSNLQIITCLGISLDVDALVHLSHIPTLAQLTFMLSNRFLVSPPPSDSLSFPALKYMELHAECLLSVARLLFWTRLPAIIDFIVTTNGCPPKRDLVSFMAGVQISGMGYTVQEFNLQQSFNGVEFFEPRLLDAPSLNLDDLRPCLAFQNLRRMKIDLDWNVDLSNDQLLMLGSEWPRVQEISINLKWGWNSQLSQGGITPLGLAQLLEMCPSLTSIALVIDTRGFIEASAGQPRRALNPSSFEEPFRINVVDSVIERRSMSAMVFFLIDIVPHFHFSLTSWVVWTARGDSDFEINFYRVRWETVYAEAMELIKNYLA